MINDVKDVVITHPNRETSSAKSMRIANVVLLLLSAVAVLLIAIGGASDFTSSLVFPLLLVFIYSGLAYLVSRWKRGALPVSTWFAVLTAIFAAVSLPGWFDRSSADYSASNLPPDLIGTVLIVLIPLQALLLIAAVKAFRQEWQVEVEVEPNQPS